MITEKMVQTASDAVFDDLIRDFDKNIARIVADRLARSALIAAEEVRDET